jgi:excisionase family DNA binding protein
MKLLEYEPVAPQENEKSTLKLLGGVFFRRSHEKKGTPRLVGPDGFEIELPDSVFQALCQVVYHMMQGRAVSIIPINKEVTTQEAADFLNVSRPFLVRMLEQGEIPFVKVGTHRRVRFSDLIAYKQRRDAARKRGLAELTHISEDEGLYD